jgi:hypothetical protein
MNWLWALVALRIVRGGKKPEPAPPAPATASGLIFGLVVTELGLGAFAWLGFASGVLLIALPCVFAMIVCGLIVFADVADAREHQRRGRS